MCPALSTSVSHREKAHYISSPAPPPIVFRHMSSSVTPLTPHHFLSRPADPGATIPLRAPSFALASTQIHQAVQAHPGGSARRPSTSQECRVGWAILNPNEAVIEVVGGG
jgi:hypothetical protein